MDLPRGIQEGSLRQTIRDCHACLSEFLMVEDGSIIASEHRMSLEVALGRWLACAVHPAAAWRKSQARERALLVATYAGAGYLATLIVLITVR